MCIDLSLVDDGVIPSNDIILKSFLVCDKHLNDIYCKYNNLSKIVVSVSGGSDSDIVLNLLYNVCNINNFNMSDMKFLMSDTGCEFRATRDHVKFLEHLYNIDIEVLSPLKPIPITCRDYGQPFLSKQVSEFMYRLQTHGFKWENRPYNELLSEYPNCKSALQWWCNMKGDKSKFNINYNKYLKEFIISYPPTFKISNKCCYYSKKKPLNKIISDGDYVLSITGIRKSEGGVRSSAFKNCFTPSNDNNLSYYRPIFFYKNSDKSEYDRFYHVEHSECYSSYGLSRTGCAGCPFGGDLIEELGIIEKYEPKLYKWVMSVYKDSYEYTLKYRSFVSSLKR